MNSTDERMGKGQSKFKTLLHTGPIIVDLIYKTVGILGLFTIISVISPQWIPNNQDYVSMANAGDPYSQVFLAEHFYEIGEYSDSIYWYKLATVNKSVYQAMACNNLGILYAQGYGLSDYENEGFYRFQKAIMLFYQAQQLGIDLEEKEIYTSNAIETIRVYWDECFAETRDYPEEINLWKEQAATQRNTIKNFYATFEIYKGRSFSEDNTYYVYSGSCVEADDTRWAHTVYKYYATTFEEADRKYKPEFMYLK